MRPSSLIAASLVTTLGIACSSVDPDGERGSIGSVSSPIVNGQVDTTHQAVVAIAGQNALGQGGLCSGTIVKVDPASRVGWVLTAAHCTEMAPVMALQGNDYSTSTLQYAVIDYKADGRYQLGGAADQPYDVAVVRIAGVDATTPTIGLPSSADGLAVGTTLTAVGYGKTSASDDKNTLRRRVSVSIGQLSSTQIAYGYHPGGTCGGDSGGPALLASGGVEKVVGITSYGDSGCSVTSVSGRASANLAFINAELAKALPAPTCDLCQKASFSGKQRCAQMTSACLADSDCKALYDCLASATTASAQQSCLSAHPTSKGKIIVIQECGCTDACATVCASDASCKDLPKCGFSFESGGCATCAETSCCQEMYDCTADGACFRCIETGDASASCASNAARKKLAACMSKSCSAECAEAGEGPGAGPGAGPGSGAGGATEGDGEDDAEEEASGDPAAGGSGTKTVTTTGCSLASLPSRRAPGGTTTLALVVGLAATAARRRRARAR